MGQRVIDSSDFGDSCRIYQTCERNFKLGKNSPLLFGMASCSAVLFGKFSGCMSQWVVGVVGVNPAHGEQTRLFPEKFSIPLFGCACVPI